MGTGYLEQIDMIVFISAKHPKLAVINGRWFLSPLPKRHLAIWDILTCPNCPKERKGMGVGVGAIGISEWRLNMPEYTR